MSEGRQLQFTARAACVCIPPILKPTFMRLFESNTRSEVKNKRISPKATNKKGPGELLSKDHDAGILRADDERRTAAPTRKNILSF